jgi:hypothetical protein
MDGLWVLREVVPEHGGVVITREMGSGITFLGVTVLSVILPIRLCESPIYMK